MTLALKRADAIPGLSPPLQEKQKWQKEIEEHVHKPIELAILHTIDDQQYWVRGYELWDEGLHHSTSKGYSTLEPKRKLRADHVWVVMPGQTGAPAQYHASRVKKVNPRKHYFTFEELYNKASTGFVPVVGVVAKDDEEEEDLTIGLHYEERDEHSGRGTY